MAFELFGFQPSFLAQASPGPGFSYRDFIDALAKAMMLEKLSWSTMSSCLKKASCSLRSSLTAGCSIVLRS